MPDPELKTMHSELEEERADFAAAGVAAVASGDGGALAASSQLPAVLRRPVDLADRDLDADRGPVVAGVSLTGSTLLLGTVGFASQIPVFLMAPIGGIVADRFNRHRVVIATQIASMMLAFILAC